MTSVAGTMSGGALLSLVMSAARESKRPFPPGLIRFQETRIQNPEFKTKDVS
jgi:hypothetical protein